MITISELPAEVVTKLLCDPRVKSFFELLTRVDAHHTQAENDRRFDNAGVLLAELVKLLAATGFAGLVRQRAAAAAARSVMEAADLDDPTLLERPLRTNSEGGIAEANAVRAAAVRVLADLRGLVPVELADQIATELDRMNGGFAPQMPMQPHHGNAAGGVEKHARYRLVLRAHFEASCQGGSWLDHVRPVVPLRGDETLAQWNKYVPVADRERARQLGQAEKSGAPRTPEDDQDRAQLLRYSLAELGTAATAGV
ncbi:MAG: hypothetical protein WCO00_16595 [Rhodospirillaceae bacterium]